MKRQLHYTFLAAMLAAPAWAQTAPESVAATNEQQQQQPAPAAPGPWRRADTAAAVQPQIILPAGAWIKIRVDQPLSSDRSRAGDGFTGTLTQPIVADGYVIAHRGQTIEGRVTEAIKAGKAKGTSRLGLELVEVGLADGQQMAVRTQLVEYNGGTSVGRDVAAIGTTTGAGQQLEPRPAAGSAPVWALSQGRWPQGSACWSRAAGPPRSTRRRW